MNNMKAIKNIFKLKDNIADANDDKIKLAKIESENSQIINELTLTMYQKGYGDSKNAHGNSSIYKSCLESIFQDFKQKCRSNEEQQHKLRTPFIEDKKRKETELHKRETALSIKIERREKHKNKIEQINNDIPKVKLDPGKFGIDATKKPRAQFYIGLFILTLVSIYLIVFYLSASYSAFFIKSFNSTEIIPAILDAQALNKAIVDGWLEALFVCTIPFTFMGLGYLIHMFLKDKHYKFIKIICLITVTFIFDLIIAYLIEKKIYDYSRTLTTPDFTFSIAITLIEFWGIIFAGFVVYLIWGLVFDFVMKEHESIDKIKLFVNSLKEEIIHLQNLTLEIDTEIEKIKHDIAELNGQIKEIQGKIDGFIFPNRIYHHLFTEYEKGWLLAISKEIALPHKEQDQLITDCQERSASHLREHDINSEDFENVIYSKAI
jgi:hypothetical protein